MRVILIGTAHPFRGGLASFNERLIEEFGSEGDAAEIYNFSLQYPNLLFPGKTQYSTSPAPENVAIYSKVNSINPFNWLKIGREISKSAPDLVLIKYWMPFMAPCFGVISRLIKRNGKTKNIAIIDNIIPHEKRPFDAILTRFFTKPVDGFIAMSRKVERQTAEFANNKPIKLSPHPIFDNFGAIIPRNEALAALNVPENKKYILFFGFIRDYKGLDLLLKAFSLVMNELEDVNLIVAGEFYSNETYYHNLIQSLNLGERVILRTDFIPNEEVKNYFCAADILALPYKNATQSGVTQIGFHFEIPMLVTRVGGLPELIDNQKTGYVVEPNEADIAAALLDYFQKNRHAEMKKSVALKKNKYSWSQMVSNIKSLYDDIQKQSTV